MDTTVVRTRRWTRLEYGRLIDCGVLREHDPIELIDGQLVVREPQHTPHAAATRLVARGLEVVFRGDWDVRAGLPVALDEASEPEPDVCVVRGGPRDYLDDHPTRPALVVEVADSSLAFDRRFKGSLYARAGLAEYWIVNLPDRCVEVYRRPVPAAAAEYGWSYRDTSVLSRGDIVAPLAAPEARISIADLLP